MAVSNEIEAQIMRYFHVEKWKVGTIARQLGIHHSTAGRALPTGRTRAGKPATNADRSVCATSKTI